MWLITNSGRDGTRAGRRIAAVLLPCVIAASAVVATRWLTIDMEADSPTARVGQPPDGNSLSRPDFYSWVQTDIRHDHAGLSTVVVAAEDKLLFNCGVVEDEPFAMNVIAVRAVFLTHLDEATTSGFEGLLDSPRAPVGPEPPLRVWGPRGTKEWMRRRLDHSLASSTSRRPFTVTELEEGPVAESNGLLVLAINVSDGHLAYVVTDPGGHSMLIATDVPPSRRLAGLSANVDVAIVRHTNERVAAEFFDRVRPGLAVLAPDGIPATVGGIREVYRGALQIVAPRPERIDVPVRPRSPGKLSAHVMRAAVPRL